MGSKSNGLACFLVAACGAVALGQTSPALPSSPADVVILATQGMVLGTNVSLSSGQLVVDNPGGVAVVRSGFNGVASATGVIADTVKAPLGSGSARFYDVFANTFTRGSGTVFTSLVSPVPQTLPLFTPPVVPTPVFGTMSPCPLPGISSRIPGDCTVRATKGPVTLPPGDYHDLRVGFKAALTFESGTYNVNLIHGAWGAILLFTGTTTINVAGALVLEPHAVLGPDYTDAPNPRCITINVAGDRAVFRALSNVSATVVAPAASMSFGFFGIYEGNFTAQTARVWEGASLSDPPSLGAVPCP